MVRTAAVVVVYNRACGDSPTCESLLEQSGLPERILVFDNSTRDMGNRAFCRERGWEYLTENKNLGLSKAYNRAVSHFAGMDWLCLLDDDTTLPGDFFTTAAAHIEECPDTDIFVPVLVQAGKVLSPWRQGAPRSRRFFDSPEACFAAPTGDLLAFNSGMLVSMKLFEDYRYDERIFLDGADYRFLMDMRRQGRRLGVLPVVCGQGFSGGERPGKEAALARFRIYAGDFRVVYEGRPGDYLALVGKRAAHLALRYRSLAFVGALLGRRGL